MEWEINIKQAHNGYILHEKTDDTSVYVAIEDEIIDEFTEQRTMFKLLTAVQDFFEVYTSKHNKVNCRVLLEENE